MSNDSLRSPLGKARGLGSAKDGFHHWWAQRLTAIALVPLALWFVISLLCSIAGSSRFAFAAWLENPWNTLLLAGLLAVVTIHARLGLQVVIEDYVHAEGKKVAMLIINKFLFIGLAVVSVFSVIKLHFFGI
jgi:succinate dehydrogenase / fumarate reductase membrane anchor subunit